MQTLVVAGFGVHNYAMSLRDFVVLSPKTTRNCKYFTRFYGWWWNPKEIFLFF
jgi:hypothetical protein